MIKKEPPRIVKFFKPNSDGTVSCIIDDIPWRLDPEKVKVIRDLAEKPNPEYQRFIIV